jgi:hypothetical protein
MHWDVWTSLSKNRKELRKQINTIRNAEVAWNQRFFGPFQYKFSAQEIHVPWSCLATGRSEAISSSLCRILYGFLTPLFCSQSDWKTEGSAFCFLEKQSFFSRCSGQLPGPVFVAVVTGGTLLGKRMACTWSWLLTFCSAKFRVAC